MEQEFSKELMSSRLEKFSKKRKVTFALLCTERLYPNFTYFSKKFKWGDPHILRSALDAAWLYIASGKITTDLENLIVNCEENMPETEDFESIHVSSALDAAVSASLLLKLIKEDKTEIAVEIASLAIDTVDMYVQELENMDPNRPDLEKIILEHPLMQLELKRQHGDLEFVKTLQFDTHEIDYLKEKFYDQKLSNLNLG